MLRYLGRYTRKGMLHESRLMQMNEHSVSFRYNDYKDGNNHKVMTVSGEEFIRRYLSHVLPKGLMRIRHFGWLSNKSQTGFNQSTGTKGSNAAKETRGDNGAGMALPALQRWCVTTGRITQTARHRTTR